MSDYIIPSEIQEEIMKRLPVKSLIRFRSVSKPLKAFIDSSEFITNYHRTQQQQQRHHLLVSYINRENRYDREYVSIADDDTFPQHKFSLTLPVSVNQLTEPAILGSSQGLLCFYDKSEDSPTETDVVIIWNPFISRSVTIPVPNVLCVPYDTVVAFGVTPDSCDPKLVKISFDRRLFGGNLGGNDTVVEVFSLSTMSWKRLTTNLPRNSTAFCVNHVAIDRFIYWHAYDLRGDRWLDQIMSFDMITEEFKELDLPDSFARDHRLFLSKVREESLAVVQKNENQVSSVWTMEHGDPKSLTKEFTINKPIKYAGVRGFRMSGEPLIKMRVDDPESPHNEHFVYQPYSGHMNSIGINKTGYSCKVTPCIETLLLLDHSEATLT